MPPVRRVVALRYMIDFRCTGPLCEDQCCGGWNILVDQGHHGKLQKLAARDPALAERVRLRLLPTQARTRAAFSVIELGPDERCPILNADRLCALHAGHGEAALPDSCAMYPRVLSKVGARLELSGSLSCPEVARRALLSPGAVDLVSAGEGVLGRGVVQQDAAQLFPGEEEALDQVRGAMQQLLGDEAYPMASRLFFSAFLAHRLGAEQGRDLAALLEAPVLLQAHRQLQEQLQGAQPAVHVIFAVLGRRMEAHGSAFHRLALEVMRSYAADPDAGVRLVDEGPDSAAIGDLDAAPLSAAYQRRRDEVLAALGGSVDGWVQHYARHFWLREWPGADLFAHAQGLLVRVALIRFLLLSHPQALAAARLAEPAERVAALSQVAVRVVYALSRIIEHNDRFAAALDSLTQGSLDQLGHSLGLLAI